MQPDPLNHEENLQEIPTQKEEEPIVESVQQPTDIPLSSPSVTARNKASNPLAMIFVWLFLFLALTSAVGLVFWAYQLNSNLTAKQQELAELQADYDQLKKDHEKQTADLGQANSELDKVKQDLSTAQADLEKAKSNNETLQGKIDKIGQYADLLDTMFSSSGKVKGKVQSIKGDSDLTELYDLYADAEKEEKVLAWLVMIRHIADQMADIAK